MGRIIRRKAVIAALKRLVTVSEAYFDETLRDMSITISLDREDGQVYYYGCRQRNYATRQQKTKRLLKQAGISYSFNVLQDMKEAGISYTRRNIVKDAFERLGVF